MSSTSRETKKHHQRCRHMRVLHMWAAPPQDSMLGEHWYLGANTRKCTRMRGTKYICIHVLEFLMYICLYLLMYMCCNVCMYIHSYVYICIYVYMYIFIHGYMYICTYVYTDMCTYAHVYRCTQVYTRICLDMYVCLLMFV